MEEQPGATRTELVPVGAATLWTQTSGQGRPLVLCHGGPGMSDNLEPLAQMVEDLVTVHRFDQRAGGRSTGVGEGQTVAGAVADLEALRAHWGHRRWLVSGHSWGATLALCYTLAHSDRVAGLLYLSGAGLDAEAAAALNQDRVRWLADPTLRRRLRKLEVPTLVLHGGRDPLPADGAAGLLRLPGGSRLPVWPTSSLWTTTRPGPTSSSSWRRRCGAGSMTASSASTTSVPPRCPGWPPRTSSTFR